MRDKARSEGWSADGTWTQPTLTRTSRHPGFGCLSGGLFALTAPVRSGLDRDENLHPNLHETRANAGGPQLVEFRAADSMCFAELGDRECRPVLRANPLYPRRFDATASLPPGHRSRRAASPAHRRRAPRFACVLFCARGYGVRPVRILPHASCPQNRTASSCEAMTSVGTR